MTAMIPPTDAIERCIRKCHADSPYSMYYGADKQLSALVADRNKAWELARDFASTVRAEMGEYENIACECDIHAAFRETLAAFDLAISEQETT